MDGYVVERQEVWIEMQSRNEKQDSPRGDDGVRIVLDEEIILREMIESDGEALYEAIDRNRAHLTKWLAWVDSTTNVESSRKFIAETRERIRLRTGLAVCIERRGRIIGTVGLTEIDPSDRNATVGYWLVAGEQGRGVVTRSCRKLIGYGIDRLGVQRFTLRAARKNRKSRNIAERLGFVKVGGVEPPEPSDDPKFDLLEYSLNAADWRPAG